MATATYSKTGTKATTAAKLDDSVFGVTVTNHELLKAAYVAYMANGRENNATTKTRGEVSGGGKKPWKQKGTGRARFGSSRVPIWRGGGITFGPTGAENYSKQLNTKAKRLAIRQALSLANDAGKIKVVEAFANLEGKTKDMAAFLDKVEAKGNIVIVVAQKDATRERAAQNIQKVKVVGATYLNVFDVLNSDTILVEKAALDTISNWLSADTKVEAK